jgi:hypothetical protein
MGFKVVSRVEGCRLDSSDADYGHMVGSCEHGNEQWESIKRWKFLEQLGLLSFQDRMSSMESVSYE